MLRAKEESMRRRSFAGGRSSIAGRARFDPAIRSFAQAPQGIIRNKIRPKVTAHPGPLLQVNHRCEFCHQPLPVT
jgi:hypothetical protein